ncbi:uroporphyrin-III methyltransferase [Chryseobacterium sp. P1-3]|uniref:Uroporphyrin-III methyltransferase n=1 Tax=Chryseobacterium gallinarum TaxID=1324352 RepID=A0A0G3M996_CHRGL|nr:MULTISPECIES: DUF488 domain-containing protein [Chryseobacterium]AKK74533.1 uroporphyrin-III methyltransferase [Chryseobacterium gallinarum]KFF75816.1 uroporphyrin-III methyltransferase [Chryseobacterium sp. P1-3]MCL8538370.1 DUF488 domain-containing protein [Chryseobacterium gallinarum]
MSAIVLKRVYETPLPTDGYRVLVDRLWPRGLSKEHAEIDEWNKDLAPSSELRKWFHHDPELWKEFSEKYWQELQKNDFGKKFLEHHKDQEKITLVYAAKDQEHCHPVILKEYLESLQ